MTLSVSLSSVRQSDGLSPKLAPMTVNVLYVYVCYSASFPVIGASSSVSRLVTTSQSQPCSSLAPSLQSILMSMQMVGLGGVNLSAGSSSANVVSPAEMDAMIAQSGLFCHQLGEMRLHMRALDVFHKDAPAFRLRGVSIVNLGSQLDVLCFITSHRHLSHGLLF